MKKVVYLLLIISVSVFISSCDEDEDITNPTLQVLFVAPTPQTSDICGEVEDNVILLKGGDLFEIELRAKDDIALSQYKIELHENFDCHGHKSNPTSTWEINDIKDLTAANADISKTYSVPTNVTAGNYHFQIDVLDASGNELAVPLIYDLKVRNSNDTIPPTISFIAPTSMSFSAAKGSSINFKGTLSDNRALEAGENAALELEYTAVGTENTIVAKTFEITNNIGQTYDFDFDFMVSNDLNSGEYIFEVEFSDGVNNAGNTVEFMINIL